jgi:hypothetical protein
MQIQCECGQFKAEIKNFPKETPGRVGCYCDDCQMYAAYLNRTDILDSAGCTEIVPNYPLNISIIQGQDVLKCVRLYEKGMFRWSTTCCNTPIGNTRPKHPWMGLHAIVFNQKNKSDLGDTLGPIKSRVMGKFAKGAPAKGTPDNLDFKAIRTVMPFLLKGFLLGKSKSSPFLKRTE